jgi:hypothetical protein
MSFLFTGTDNAPVHPGSPGSGHETADRFSTVPVSQNISLPVKSYSSHNILRYLPLGSSLPVFGSLQTFPSRYYREVKRKDKHVTLSRERKESLGVYFNCDASYWYLPGFSRSDMATPVDDDMLIDTIHRATPV